MAFPVSLHQLTSLDSSPAELVAQAGAHGCDHVCLFTYVPAAAAGRYPLVMPADVPDLRRRMADAGASLCNIEVFPLNGQEDWAGFDAALETGAALGATKATAHVHDATSPEEAIARFAAFCDRAAPYGITAGLEFHAFTGIPDIAAAAAVVRGANRPNGQLVCDSLHLIRNGGSVADVRAHADIIGYGQMSDGPLVRPRDDWWKEAVSDRALPGTGGLPLVEIFAALRPGTVIEVEVPQGPAAKAGVPAAERVRRAVEATRTVLAAAMANMAAA